MKLDRQAGCSRELECLVNVRLPGGEGGLGRGEVGVGALRAQRVEVGGGIDEGLEELPVLDVVGSDRLRARESPARMVDPLRLLVEGALAQNSEPLLLVEARLGGDQGRVVLVYGGARRRGGGDQR